MDKTNDPPLTLGAHLLALREVYGLSQSLAAGLASAAPATWRAVERGERLPSAEDLGRFLAACRATDEERATALRLLAVESKIVTSWQTPAEGEG